MNFTEDDFQKLKNRDKDLLKKFYLAFCDKIYSYFFIKLNGDKELSEELSSEVFCSAISSIHNLKDIMNISSWIYKIASNIFNNHLRKKYRDKKYLGKLYENESYNEESINNLINKQKKMIFDLAFEKLSTDYQEIMKLKYIKNKSLIEIAEMYDKSVTAVENILYKAKIKIKKEIKKISKDFLDEI